MKNLTKILPTVAMSVCVVLVASALRADDPGGTIAGMLVTKDGQAKYAGRAVVFVCDAKTGRPLLADTKTILNGFEQLGDSLETFWHVVTQMDSSFKLEHVPAGQYRLVAQSWSGVEGLPTTRTTSAYVLVHGAANNVEVKAGETTFAPIRALGNGVMHVETDPNEEPVSYLIVGTQPTWGDQILSYYGWGDNYTRNIVAVTHMSVPHATFIGLPDDSDVHVSLYCYDNLPGSGGTTFRVGRDRTATIRIFGAWSNGHDEPPANLLPLVEYMEQHKSKLPALMKLPPNADIYDARGKLDSMKLRTVVFEHGEQQVEVAGVGKFRLIDIVAADGYRRLRAYRRR